MIINELFKKLEKNFQKNRLNGEITLQRDCIVWTYILDDGNELMDTAYNSNEIESEIESISFEELLQDAYNEDLDKIETFLDEIDESEKWVISDADVIENVISFKIF